MSEFVLIQIQCLLMAPILHAYFVCANTSSQVQFLHDFHWFLWEVLFLIERTFSFFRHFPWLGSPQQSMVGTLIFWVLCWMPLLTCGQEKSGHQPLYQLRLSLIFISNNIEILHFKNHQNLGMIMYFSMWRNQMFLLLCRCTVYTSMSHRSSVMLPYWIRTMPVQIVDLFFVYLTWILA